MGKKEEEEKGCGTPSEALGDEQELIGWEKKQRAHQAEWMIYKKHVKTHGVVNVNGPLEAKLMSDPYKAQNICRRMEGSDY